MRVCYCSDYTLFACMVICLYIFMCECVLLLVLHIIIDVHVLSVTKRCSIFLERVEKSKELSVSALWRSFFNASKSRKRTTADSDSEYVPSTSTSGSSSATEGDTHTSNSSMNLVEILQISVCMHIIWLCFFFCSQQTVSQHLNEDEPDQPTLRQHQHDEENHQRKRDVEAMQQQARLQERRQLTLRPAGRKQQLNVTKVFENYCQFTAVHAHIFLQLLLLLHVWRHWYL